MINKIFGSNKKGITITSLTIYVVVATIIVGILVFLNANFFSNINELTDRANVVAESMDFKSAFIKDLKSENGIKVTDYNNNMIRLSNNVKYELRVLDKEAENKKFAIYRNDVQIAKNIVSHTTIEGQDVKEGPFFEYDVATNTVKVGIKFADEKNSYVESGTYVVGKDVRISWENSADNIFRPEDSGDKEDEDTDVPEEERIYAFLYGDFTLQLSNTNSIDTNKALLKNYGEVSRNIKNGNPLWNDNRGNIKVVNVSEPIMLQSLENIFAGCTNLTQIQNPSNMNVVNVVSAKNAFKDCISLGNIDITSWNTSNIVNMNGMFDGCSSLQTINLNNFITTNVEDMSKMFRNCSSIDNLTFNTISTAKVRNMSEMFSGCASLKNLDLNRLVTSNVTDMSSMFSNCTSLVSLNISYLDTSNVTSVSKLFYNCQSLSNVNISNFSATDIQDLSYMFYNCLNLNSVTLGNMSTENVTDISYMFWNCAKLNTINLENIDTSNVINMEGLFYNCQGLTEWDFATFSTENVENMSRMFAGCVNLETLTNLDEFDTRNAKNMSEMFLDCKSLKQLNLNVSKFETTKVSNMSGMFEGCNNLSQLIINNFDTTQLSNMSRMFADCDNLTELDLTSFDTRLVLDMSELFSGDSKLMKIYVSSTWITTDDTDMTDMFEGCGVSVLDKV